MLRMLAEKSDSLTAARSGRWVCALAGIAFIFSGATFASWFASRVWLGGWASLALFIACISVSVLIAQYFYDQEALFEQRDRDLRAKCIWEALSRDAPPPEPFILYLRPFASTDYIDEVVDRFIQIGDPRLGNANLAMTSDRLEFEEQIERALRPLGLLVALGVPLEQIGAGRILVTDDTWKPAILRLIEAADLIVLLPSSTTGTIFEVERILSSEHVRKTIVVDPPNRPGEQKAAFATSAEWENIRQAFDRHKFALPDDRETGSLIWFGDRDAPQKVSPISLDGYISVRRFAEDVMTELRLNKQAPQSSPRNHANA